MPSTLSNNTKGLNLEAKAPNYILIGIVAIFSLLAILIIVYVFSDWFKPGSVTKGSSVAKSETPASNKVGTTDGAIPSTPTKGVSTAGSGPEVFNIAENVFTYDDADAVCKAYGAELATYDQLVDAYKKGANWCNYGWSKGQLILYPIQKSFWDQIQENEPERRDDCGQPGINGGYEENKNMQFGVNCYGVKRVPTADENLKQAYVSDQDRETMEKINRFKQQLGTLRLNPFNENKWTQ